MIFFAYAQYVPYVLILLIILCCLIFVRMHRQRALLSKLVAPAYFEHLVKHFSWRRFYLKNIVLLCAIALLCVALLRPQTEGDSVIGTIEKRDVFVALDVSRSMLAQDCVPDRLTCAKNAIKKLIRSLACERVGLIAFSATAVILCPLTTDMAAFEMFVDSIDHATLSASGTNVASALTKALEGFAQAKAQTDQKLVVMFTDGEDFALESADLVRAAHEQGMGVCAVGIGTYEGAPIPTYDQHHRSSDYVKDDSGSVVISRLDELSLKRIIGNSGMYIKMTSSDEVVRAIMAWLERFEKQSLEEQHKGYNEYYYYPAAIACALLLVEWFL